MSSMFEKIARAKGCTSCKITLETTHSGRKHYNVSNCEACKESMKSKGQRLESMSLEDYIREVVNGRACVSDSSSKNHELYNKYFEDMPYGVKKARDGDPDEWITERLYCDYSDLIEEEAECV